MKAQKLVFSWCKVEPRQIFMFAVAVSNAFSFVELDGFEPPTIPIRLPGFLPLNYSPIKNREPLQPPETLKTKIKTKCDGKSGIEPEHAASKATALPIELLSSVPNALPLGSFTNLKFLTIHAPTFQRMSFGRP